MSESVRVQIVGALWGVEADLYDGNGEVLADAAIAAYADALLPLVEQLTAEARAEVTAAVEALADRWGVVLDECRAADPRWILDRSITTLDTALTELRAALTDRDALRKRDGAKWAEGYSAGVCAPANRAFGLGNPTNPYQTGDTDE